MSDLNLDLCYMTATEAIAAFKTRALSPVELRTPQTIQWFESMVRQRNIQRQGG